MAKSKSKPSKASSSVQQKTPSQSCGPLCAPDFSGLFPSSLFAPNEAFFQPFSSFQRDIGNFFSNAFKEFSCKSPFQAFDPSCVPSIQDFQSACRSLGFPFPGVDLKEDDSSFTIAARVPETNPENVDVSVSDNCVTISCSSSSSKAQKAGSGAGKIFSAQSFYKTIALPEVANASKAEADFKNGILTITVPKRKDSIEKARKIPIGKKSA